MSNNIVFIGKKDRRDYVSTVMGLVEKGVSPILIKARGVLINQAADIALFSEKRISGLRISEVRLVSERLTANDSSLRDVSAIEITMTLS